MKYTHANSRNILHIQNHMSIADKIFDAHVHNKFVCFFSRISFPSHCRLETQPHKWIWMDSVFMTQQWNNNYIFEFFFIGRRWQCARHTIITIHLSIFIFRYLFDWAFWPHKKKKEGKSQCSLFGKGAFYLCSFSCYRALLCTLPCTMHKWMDA